MASLPFLWPFRAFSQINHMAIPSGQSRNKESLLMISPEMYVKIRRLFYAEHWKIGTIASELGIHWDTVRSVIESDSFNDKQIHRTRMRVTDP
jgi:hypothetical protein